jgi:hypothetical protein
MIDLVKKKRDQLIMQIAQKNKTLIKSKLLVLMKQAGKQLLLVPLEFLTLTRSTWEH